MARTIHGNLTGRAGAEELRDARQAILDAQVPAQVKYCADCGGLVGIKPLWMAGGKTDLCFGCAEELDRAERQAILWAADQLKGRDWKREALAEIHRIKQEILSGEISGVWVSEFRTLMAILWDAIQISHESSVAGKGGAR